MKKIINSGLLSTLLLILFTVNTSIRLVAQKTAAAPITFQAFYDNLSPYGTWIDYPGYGLLWNPNITGYFRPYVTNGFAGHINIINNFDTTHTHQHYSAGMDLNEVETYTHYSISPFSFKDVPRISDNRNEKEVMSVYRPPFQNLQPHEFRSANAGHINAIYNEAQNPCLGRMDQRNNVQSLPTHRDQEGLNNSHSFPSHTELGGVHYSPFSDNRGGGR